MRVTALLLLLLGCETGDPAAPDVGLDAADAEVGGEVDVDAADSGGDEVGVDAADVGDDSAPGSLDDCFAGLAPRVATRTVNLLDFEAEGGAVRVRLAREIGERSFVGETLPYDLVRFGIERDGAADCVTDPGALVYDFGHHNWNERAAATGTHAYVVRMVYDISGTTAVWTDTLAVDDGAEVPLTFVDCRSIPTIDLNHCLMRGGGG